MLERLAINQPDSFMGPTFDAFIDIGKRFSVNNETDDKKGHPQFNEEYNKFVFLIIKAISNVNIVRVNLQNKTPHFVRTYSDNIVFNDINVIESNIHRRLDIFKGCFIGIEFHNCNLSGITFFHCDFWDTSFFKVKLGSLLGCVFEANRFFRKNSSIKTDFRHENFCWKCEDDDQAIIPNEVKEFIIFVPKTQEFKDWEESLAPREYQINEL